MRIPITKYGLPQAAVFPLVILLHMFIFYKAGKNLLPTWGLAALELLLAALIIFVLSFFRDPKRQIPDDKNILLSPADGKVADIEIMHNDFMGGKALRVGIFLSVFNVHINRSPCDVKVEKIIYKKGGFKDARHPEAGAFNESNDLYLTRKGNSAEKLIVRQISGAIARRIVCKAKAGEELAGGQKFGMIKFGSRTELYVPAKENIKCVVKIGDNVKAGLTSLIEIK